MHATVPTVTPPVGPYRIPAKSGNNSEKRAPHRAYRRQDEFGLCNSPREWDVPISKPASSPFSTVVEMPKKRIIRSPRCTIEDERISPSSDHTKYQNSETRWQCISEQAGAHRQDGSVMTITRNLSPQALTKGLTKYAASRVKCLNLWLDHHEDMLPEWLDVIANLLVNLQHLTLSQDVFPGEEDEAVSARMRRLYVLYRLPFLKSIDDEPVSREEKKLSRPNDPNGERVQRDDWVGNDSLLDEDDDHDAVPFEMDDDVAPPLVATESIGNQTAIELGAELQELAEKVVALDEVENDDMSDTLTGIKLIDVPMNSSGSGEAREDNNSNTTSIGDRDGNSTTKWQTPLATDALEVDLSGAVQSVGQRARPIIQLDENTLRDDGSTRSLKDQIRTSGTYEVLSVASSSHEWTAACGVLAFRTDRACAPRLKMPFCGNRKQIADDGSFTARERAKKALREKHMKERQLSACPPVQRHSSMKSPSDRDKANDISKFFPAPNPIKFFPPTQKSPVEELSANKKLPPSKSLSSPFPMQFRERTAPVPPKPPTIERIDTSIIETIQAVSRLSPRDGASSPMETITGPLSATSFSPPYPPKKQLSYPKSPSQGARSPSKGGLPPPCPGGRRKVPVPPTASALKSRKARKMARKLKASKENARYTSVFDIDDDDDDDDDSVDSVEDTNGDDGNDRS
jgi:hypothetical protein